MLQATVFIILFMTATIKTEERQDFFKIEENRFYPGGVSIWEGAVDSLTSCSLMCARQAGCSSANFEEGQGACSLFTQEQRHQYAKRHTLSQQQGSFYLEKVGVTKISAPPGASQLSAVPSCQTLLNQSPQTPSGVYWIDPDGGSQTNAFKAYCDMETDGGGWTLVWSYTFTNYVHFTDGSNAITPRPNWPVKPEANVAISTIPPLNETHYNALNFSLWKRLGSQVLVKSNINNWLKCDPGTGSLVDWKRGSVSCQIVRRVTDKCRDKQAPSTFAPINYGPMFKTSETGIYYYFDCYTGNYWPTHDPCGENKGNHVKNVSNPHGNIFIRMYAGINGS